MKGFKYTLAVWLCKFTCKTADVILCKLQGFPSFLVCGYEWILNCINYSSGLDDMKMEVVV